MRAMTYYEPDLALVHHEGFGFHVDRTAEGILQILSQTVVAGARVLDVGCGSGLLAARLVEAGYETHGVDASAPMIALARKTAPGAHFRVATLPGASLPKVDAIVSTGHVLAYLPSPESILAALKELADALEPGGVLAVDHMTPDYCERRDIDDVVARVEEEWTIIVRFARPSPEKFVREITTFVREGSGFRRADETHLNFAVAAEDASAVLSRAGLSVEKRSSFGGEALPPGLVVLVARRPK